MQNGDMTAQRAVSPFWRLRNAPTALDMEEVGLIEENVERRLFSKLGESFWLAALSKIPCLAG